MKRGERGSTMIEFAFSSVLLIGLFSGVFQFGYTFYAYNTLVNAVRDGARYASLRPYDSTASGDFQTAVQNRVVYGSPNPPLAAAPILKGLTASNVAIVVTPGPSASVTVSITNFQINAVFSNVALNGRPRATYPYTGTVVQ